MSLVNENTLITALPAFELFSNAPAQTSVEKTRTDFYRPISQLNTGGYMEFDVNSNPYEYIQLNDIFLYVKFRVKLTKTDATATNKLSLKDWDNVSLVNNVIHSMFNQVDLSINDRQITVPLLTYAQKAYLENILFTTEEARNSYLKLAGFYIDAEKTHYDVDLSEERKLLICHSEFPKAKKDKTAATEWTTTENPEIGKQCELTDRIHIDLLRQDKYMIGNTKLHFKFVLNRPEFLFMIKDNKIKAEIIFLDVILKVPKAIVSGDLEKAQNQAIKVSPVKYPIDRFEVRTQTIESGVTTKSINNFISHGQLPKKIYVAFVENQAFSGSYTQNPYLFKHFDISSIICFVNNVGIQYKPDFTNYLTLESYMGLCKVTNQDNNSHCMGVSKRMFDFGHTIFAFNICPDGSEGYSTSGHVNQPVKGDIGFEIVFKTPTTTVINAIFFCNYDNQISVNEDRIPYCDFM